MINEIEYSIERVDGFQCPSKYLLSINNKIVCFCNTVERCKQIIKYAVNLDENILEDKKIKRKVRNIVNR